MATLTKKRIYDCNAEVSVCKILLCQLLVIFCNAFALLFVLTSSTAALHKLGVSDGEKPALNHHNYLWFLSEGLGVFFWSICHRPTKLLGISVCQFCHVLWAHIDTSKFALNSLGRDSVSSWKFLLGFQCGYKILTNPVHKGNLTSVLRPCWQCLCVPTSAQQFVWLHRIPWYSLSKVGFNLENSFLTLSLCLGSYPVPSSGTVIKCQVLVLADRDTCPKDMWACSVANIC